MNEPEWDEQLALGVLVGTLSSMEPENLVVELTGGDPVVVKLSSPGLLKSKYRVRLQRLDEPAEEGPL